MARVTPFWGADQVHNVLPLLSAARPKSFWRVFCYWKRRAGLWTNGWFVWKPATLKGDMDIAAADHQWSGLGSMYALIALGYTMVYGIIQLINFAHGEVLMVGRVTSWSCIGLMQAAFRRRAGSSAAGHHHRLRGGGLLNFDRKGGLPAAAQQPASGAADHRHRRVHPAADLAMIIWKPNTRLPTLLSIHR
jgi:hypothetical protein